MKGQIYSLTNFFVEDRVEGDVVYLTNQKGQELKTNKETLKTAMSSADSYSEEQKVTMKELTGIVRENANKAISIYYQTVNKKKSKKAYITELQDQAKEVGKEFMAKGISAIEDALKSPVLEYIPGEMRLFKGYNPGGIGDNGFFNFVDMEDNFMIKSASVNPRTIEYVIVNNIKYIKK